MVSVLIGNVHRLTNTMRSILKKRLFPHGKKRYIRDIFDFIILP